MALTDNLQAFYKLSDTSDSSGNGNTLTNEDNVIFSSGKIGTAATFNGTNRLRRELFDPSINTALPFAISFWAKPTTNVLGCVVGDGNEAGFNIVNSEDGTLYFNNAQSGDCALSDAFEVGVWKHYACMVSNGNTIVYINGQMAYNEQSNVSYEAIATSISIGSYYGSVNQSFDGQIDAVGIWNRALSDAEVAELYNNGSGLELEGVAQPTLVKMQAPVKFFGKVKFGV